MKVSASVFLLRTFDGWAIFTFSCDLPEANYENLLEPNRDQLFLRFQKIYILNLDHSHRKRPEYFWSLTIASGKYTWRKSI
jgi:hypothetical protein